MATKATDHKLARLLATFDSASALVRKQQVLEERIKEHKPREESSSSADV